MFKKENRIKKNHELFINNMYRFYFPCKQNAKQQEELLYHCKYCIAFALNKIKFAAIFFSEISFAVFSNTYKNDIELRRKCFQFFVDADV